MREPILTVLEAYVGDSERENWINAPVAFAAQDVLDCPDTRSSVIRAVQALSSLTWPQRSTHYVVNRLYLARWTIPDAPFNGLGLRSARLHHVTFEKCGFVQAFLIAWVGDNVVFKGGYFRDANFTLWDIATNKLLSPSQADRVHFADVEEANAGGFTINGMPFAEWQRAALPPPPRSPFGKIITDGTSA